MKLKVIFFSCAFALSANAQNVNIPDNNFKNALLAHGSSINGNGISNIDINNDNEIQLSEAAAYNGVINVSNQNISDLTGIEAFTSLRSLYCFQNNLTSINVSQNTGLASILCYRNNITSLDISQNTSLTRLECYRNNIESLDVRQNTSLTWIGCHHNSLSSLDISQNTALEKLHCNNNNLTNLDLSQNTVLKELRTESNNLTSLDVSQNTDLVTLNCGQNNLMSLDVSQCSNLDYLYCVYGSLKSLNVANGNNTGLIVVSVDLNPDLSCIQHDANFDPSSNANWTKDSTATWNDNCGCLVTSSTDIQKHCSTNNYTWIDGNTYTQDTIGAQHTLVNAAGCDSIVTLNLAFIQPPTVSIEYSNYELVATGANSFEWYLNGNLIPNANNSTLFLQNTGDYFAIGSFSESCSDTSNVVSISIDQLDVIENNATHFRIYPNPTNGIVTIQSEAEINNIELINNLGQKVAQFNQKNFDISEIKNGVYFVKVTTKLGDTIMKRLIKQ